MTLFSDAKLPPTPLEVLISQMAQYRDINSVLGKALGVLGHAKFFEPVCNLLHCGAPSERTLRCACEHISLRRELGHPVPQRRCRPHGGVGWSCALGGRGRPACCGPGNGPHCPWRVPQCITTTHQRPPLSQRRAYAKQRFEDHPRFR